jgi:hypothetical protein
MGGDVKGQQGEVHKKRERPGDGVEPEVEDFTQLVANCIAAPGEVWTVLTRAPASVLRSILLDEAMTRAVVLLREAKGDKVRAYDALQQERRRWHR